MIYFFLTYFLNMIEWQSADVSILCYYSDYQTSMYQNYRLLGQIPIVSDSVGEEWAQFAFFKSFKGMLMLLLRGPHFENPYLIVLQKLHFPDSLAAKDLNVN